MCESMIYVVYACVGVKTRVCVGDMNSRDRLCRPMIRLRSMYVSARHGYGVRMRVGVTRECASGRGSISRHQQKTR